MKSVLFLVPALLLTLSLRAAPVAGAAAPAAARTAVASILRPAARPQDTITVRLPNGVVMTLLVRDAAQLRQLKTYHLDSLTSRLGTYIAQAEAAAKTAKTERVTVEFYPDKDQPGQNLPEQIRITTRKSQPDRNRVEVLLNQGFGMTVRIDDEGKKTYVLGKGDLSPDYGKSRRDSVRRAKRENRGFDSDLRLDVGLNTFVNKKPYATAAGLPTGNLELRPEGSRYVNFGYDFVQRLGGRRSPMYLSLGAQFTFNNYMLQGNNLWVNSNGRTEVVGETEGRELQKSKLATYSINFPLMLTMKLRNDKGQPAFKLGAGGFIGQMQRQHTKLKYYEDGNVIKDKSRGSYNLTEFQYGLQGSLGLGGLSFFGKYNLNELFKAGRGPQTQVLSFGVTVSGL